MIEPQTYRLPEKAFMAGVGDDGMAGTLKQGDIALCDPSGKDYSVSTDGLYIVSLEGGPPVIRRLQGLPKGALKVVSDNRIYESYTVTRATDFKIHGRVIWIVRKT